MKEMGKFASVSVVYDATANPNSLNTNNWTVKQDADFFHMVDDDTSSGIELKASNLAFLSKIPADQPVVCDMSSTFLSKPIDWSKFGVVYANAAKHSVTGSACFVVVRNDLIGRQAANTPAMLSWASYKAQPDTFPNTPNTWGVYMCGLNIDYMLVQGGLGEMYARSLARSQPLYEFIDNCGGFYSNKVPHSFRSCLNITIQFRGDTEKVLVTKFIQESRAADIIGLEKVEAATGTCCVTMNNHTLFESIYALIAFMENFKAQNS